MLEFDLLLEAVEEITGITRKDIVSKRRFRNIADVRVICSILLKTYCKNLSTKEIGACMNVNHASVSHHRKKHIALMYKSTSIKRKKENEYENLFNQIEQKYIAKLAISGGDLKQALLNKKASLEKMLQDINTVLDSIEEGVVQFEEIID